MPDKRFQPPYYAAIFISQLSKNNDGYAEMAQQMLELAQTMPGFLGVESAREQVGITVSFWRDEASIANWRRQTQHQQAQKLGREQWYKRFEIHIARVERVKFFPQ
jgi:heme-degrading monooxygenase HmoA